jgi:hypothetical protein
MLNTDKEFKIISTGGEETTFHIMGNDIIPYSNFQLAQEWFAGDKLTPESKKLMEKILEHKKR